MRKLFVLLVALACTNKPVVEHSQKRRQVALNEALPVVRVLRQAERIRDRLRYFAEEIKTTYKPEKQRALLADVQKTVTPACEEIEKVLAEAGSFAEREQAVAMQQVCRRLDDTLTKRNLDELKPLFREFNVAMARLQKAAQP
ncbi:MAG: hypothetical protein RMM17_08550 [Acidobacteriota bacterium]|nr:hypothetical protein [Blastocatellia bacterium]MDW8412717.1 hypothetical protein [Acidobacteriota bacterium]